MGHRRVAAAGARDVIEVNVLLRTGSSPWTAHIPKRQRSSAESYFPLAPLLHVHASRTSRTLSASLKETRRP